MTRLFLTLACWAVSSCTLLLDFNEGIPCTTRFDCIDSGSRCFRGGCVADPVDPLCGDSVVEGSEECDDGNEVDGDGCSNECRIIRCDGEPANTNTNCGGCGRSCFGGTCVDQVCEPVVLVDSGSPRSITTDGQLVYWVSDDFGDGSIRRIAVGGGTESQMISGRILPTDITVDDTHVYWVGHDSFGTLERINKTTLVHEVLADNLAEPHTMAMGSSQVFWLQDSSSTEVPILVVFEKDPAEDPRVFVLLETASLGRSLAATNEGLYWIEDTGRIVKQPFATPSPILIADGEDNPQRIAVNDTHVYWTSAPSSGGSIRRRLRNGSGFTETVAAAREPGALALDDQFVFWIDDDGLWRRSLDGTLSVRIYDRRGFDLALTDTQVVWTRSRFVYRASKQMTARADGS